MDYIYYYSFYNLDLQYSFEFQKNQCLHHLYELRICFDCDSNYIIYLIRKYTDNTSDPTKSAILLCLIVVSFQKNLEKYKTIHSKFKEITVLKYTVI